MDRERTCISKPAFWRSPTKGRLPVMEYGWLSPNTFRVASSSFLNVSESISQAIPCKVRSHGRKEDSVFMQRERSPPAHPEDASMQSEDQLPSKLALRKVQVIFTARTISRQQREVCQEERGWKRRRMVEIRLRSKPPTFS